MDKDLLKKSIKFFALTIFLMFMGPVFIYQAFKNVDHIFYIPVLVLGILFSIGAIGFGFYSIRTIINGLFNKN